MLIFWSPCGMFLWVLIFWRCGRSKVCWCSNFDAYFEVWQELHFVGFSFWRYRRLNTCWCWMFEVYFKAQVLCFCGVLIFWTWRRQNVQLLIHILKLKSLSSFVSLDFLKVQEVKCVSFEWWMHIWSPNPIYSWVSIFWRCMRSNVC